MKVLAVENNAELLKLLSHLLEKEGFEVATAMSGIEAQEKFAAQKPDIVCLDILLEDISGLELCRQFRAADADIPIILITSKSRAADVKDGMAAGASEYIVKPFDLNTITQMMHKVARGRLASANQNEHFDFGDLRVYPARLSGERASGSIDLNFRELAILRLLHDNRGKEVAATDIARLCWKAEASPDSKSVEWQMRQIGKKVEQDPASPTLIRAQGAGYIHG